ncbi:MAG: hypothetical protein K6D55_10340 [Prevotella sp.]|nr:hypothetical protein [Prevotella sp.]
MKKLFIIAAMAALTLGAQAQERLLLSTYNGTNLNRYDGKVCNVTVNRLLYTGWNTLSLPFSMTEQELNDAFGSDCRLERLASAEDNAQGITLNFVNCKAGGLQANTPYMLYFSGETATKKIIKETEVSNAPSVITLTTPNGETVTMSGVQKHIDGEGLYGVMARDNSEVKFVSVGQEKTSGFYATRCHIRLSSGTNKLLTAQHLGYGEATSINAIANSDELVDVYTAAGTKVASQIRAAEVSNLRPAIYIVKGQKILVK